MTKKQAYRYGHESGAEAFRVQFDTDRDDELRVAYENDRLGEIVSQVLESWQQTADTIYYQGVSDAALDAFEEGFMHGFEQQAEATFNK